VTTSGVHPHHTPAQRSRWSPPITESATAPSPSGLSGVLHPERASHRADRCVAVVLGIVGGPKPRATTLAPPCGLAQRSSTRSAVGPGRTQSRSAPEDLPHFQTGPAPPLCRPRIRSEKSTVGGGRARSGVGYMVSREPPTWADVLSVDATNLARHGANASARDGGCPHNRGLLVPQPR
jgi:hypothetical protein